MYTIRIETNNAAFEFQPGAEVARILRRLADTVEESGLSLPDVTLRDINGNVVGRAKEGR